MDLYEIKTALAGGRTIYDLPLRCTYYARVSTDKDEQAHSLRAQIGYYEDYIRACPNWIFVQGYIDEGLSATSVSKRTSFLNMIRDAEQGLFDFVVTKEISRFSRSTLDSIKYTQKLMKCGVGVFFESDNINTLLPDAELRLTIMSSIAQDEVRKISERVRFGHRRSIEKGVVLGNNSIWGYSKEHGRLVIVEKEAAMVREIFDLYANEGLGVRRVCEQLGKMGYLNSNGKPISFTTVRNIISNPKYKGFYCGGKSVKIDYRMNSRKHIKPENWVQYKASESVPPIVSEELWERANKILDARSESQSAGDKTSYTNKYSYSGKLVCANDGERYYRAFYRCAGGGSEVWQCRIYSQKGSSGCRSPKVYTKELDDIIRACLLARLPDRAKITSRLIKIYSALFEDSGASRDIARARADISGMEAKKDKLLDLSVEGRISNEEFERRNKTFNLEIARFESIICKLENKEKIVFPAENIKKAIKSQLEFPSGFSPALIDSVLESTEVQNSQTGEDAILELRLKISPGREVCKIKRSRGKASVCTRQYI